MLSKHRYCFCGIDGNCPLKMLCLNSFAEARYVFVGCINICTKPRKAVYFELLQSDYGATKVLIAIRHVWPCSISKMPTGGVQRRGCARGMVSGVITTHRHLDPTDFHLHRLGSRPRLL